MNLKRFEAWHGKHAPPDPTFFSAFIFLSNVLTTLYNGEYLYCLLFSLLFTSSIFYRLYYSNALFIIDTLAIALIVLYGGYVFYNRSIPLTQSLIILIAFITCPIVFCYGYLTNQYCYHPDPAVGKAYTSLMHIISSIGHHLIARKSALQ